MTNALGSSVPTMTNALGSYLPTMTNPLGSYRCLAATRPIGRSWIYKYIRVMLTDIDARQYVTRLF